MAGQLIPPPEIAIERIPNLMFDQKIAIWADLMNTCETLLRARLRSEVGPEGDVDAAFAEWYERQMAEHDRDLERMARRFRRCLHGNSTI
jgi:hypothetical protein